MAEAQTVQIQKSRKDQANNEEQLFRFEGQNKQERKKSGEQIANNLVRNFNNTINLITEDIVWAIIESYLKKNKSLNALMTYMTEEEVKKFTRQFNDYLFRHNIDANFVFIIEAISKYAESIREEKHLAKQVSETESGAKSTPKKKKKKKKKKQKRKAKKASKPDVKEYEEPGWIPSLDSHPVMPIINREDLEHLNDLAKLEGAFRVSFWEISRLQRREEINNVIDERQIAQNEELQRLEEARKNKIKQRRKRAERPRSANKDKAAAAENSENESAQDSGIESEQDSENESEQGYESAQDSENESEQGYDNTQDSGIESEQDSESESEQDYDSAQKNRGRPLLFQTVDCIGNAMHNFYKFPCNVFTQFLAFTAAWQVAGSLAETPTPTPVLDGVTTPTVGELGDGSTPTASENAHSNSIHNAPMVTDVFIDPTSTALPATTATPSASPAPTSTPSASPTPSTATPSASPAPTATPSATRSGSGSGSGSGLGSGFGLGSGLGSGQSQCNVLESKLHSAAVVGNDVSTLYALTHYNPGAYNHMRHRIFSNGQYFESHNEDTRREAIRNFNERYGVNTRQYENYEDFLSNPPVVVMRIDTKSTLECVDGTGQTNAVTVTTGHNVKCDVNVKTSLYALNARHQPVISDPENTHKFSVSMASNGCKNVKSGEGKPEILQLKVNGKDVSVAALNQETRDAVVSATQEKEAATGAVQTMSDSVRNEQVVSDDIRIFPNNVPDGINRGVENLFSAMYTLIQGMFDPDAAELRRNLGSGHEGKLYVDQLSHCPEGSSTQVFTLGTFNYEPLMVANDNRAVELKGVACVLPNGQRVNFETRIDPEKFDGIIQTNAAGRTTFLDISELLAMENPTTSDIASLITSTTAAASTRVMASSSPMPGRAKASTSHPNPSMTSSPMMPDQTHLPEEEEPKIDPALLSGVVASCSIAGSISILAALAFIKVVKELKKKKQKNESESGKEGETQSWSDFIKELFHRATCGLFMGNHKHQDDDDIEMNMQADHGPVAVVLVDSETEPAHVDSPVTTTEFSAKQSPSSASTQPLQQERGGVLSTNQKQGDTEALDEAPKEKECVKTSHT